MYSKPEKRFLTFSLATIIAVYLLILVGGIVRSTGSGMGCPDWPKCFNRWSPPTDVSQLPADYAEQLTAKRLAKNKRFYKVLDFLGVDHAPISAGHNVAEDIVFNPTKAWIEYANRLVGVAIGFLIFLTFVFSVKLYKNAPVVTWLSLVSFVLVCFQGWLGSIVVSTNLFPGLITLHMLLALALVLLLIYAYAYVRKDSFEDKILRPQGVNFIKLLALLLMVFTIAQIVVGTQVREGVDQVAVAYKYLYRESWVARLGDIFVFHREMAIAVLVINAVLGWMVRRTFEISSLSWRLFVANSLLLIIQIISGFVLAKAGLPAALQPVHLLLATLMVGLQFYFIYRIFRITSLTNLALV